MNGSQADGKGAHQSSRDPRVTNEEICVRTARHSHKSGHLLAELCLRRRPSGMDCAGVVFGRPRTGLAIRGGLVLNDSMKPIETSLEQALLHANKQARRGAGFFVIPSMGD